MDAIEKIRAYADVTPGEISAKPVQSTRHGRLWHGWVGLVKGGSVATVTRGIFFSTFCEARSNAELFVEECRAIVGRGR